MLSDLPPLPDDDFIDLELVDPADDLEFPASASRGSIAGTLLSLVLHAWLVLTLSGIIVEAPRLLPDPPLETRFVDRDKPAEPEQVIRYELANPEERELEVRKTLNAQSLGLALSTRPKIETAPEPLKEIDPTLTRAPLYDVPEGMELAREMIVQGLTGDGLIQIESALDRITWEIARHLQERRVLVVWLLDASGSVVPQRSIIAKRLQRVYGELDALTGIEEIPQQDRHLLSGVVLFGAQTTFLTPDPTSDFSTVVTELTGAPTDPSGKEHVFTAVDQILSRWSEYRTHQGRRILIVTITDEAGDDYGRPLETAIAKCRRYGAKCYVVGPASVFGRRQGYVAYVAPEDGKTYQLPVDIGPESAMVENVELPFWYEGPQYTHLTAGFGPYALSRLVHETGGVYFMTNMTTTAGLTPIGAFDAGAMKPFAPDYRYSSPEDLLEDLGSFPLRRAVVTAAQFSQTTDLKALGTPRTELRGNPDNFKQVLTDAQKSVAISQLAIENVLSAFPEGIEKHYDLEPSLRWRMSFSLAYGRLLAQKARCYEYNAACAQLKNQYTPDDVRSKVNRWIFRPDRDINYAPPVKKMARVAEEHLQRILEEAPGTPWAVLAARELKDGFGIRVVEQYIPPPPPPKPGTPRPRRPRPRIAPEPAPPAQPAPKPQPPVLPKL